MEEKLNEIISYLMVIEQESPNRELCKRIDSLIEISQAINYTRCCNELKVFKKGDKVVVDGCLDAEIILKNETTYRVKYIDDQDFGDVGINGLEIKNL